jgi:hypothetical protein
MNVSQLMLRSLEAKGRSSVVPAEEELGLRAGLHREKNQTYS